MPLFLCRWPNGDCSIVMARNKEAAMIELDDVANPEGCPIMQLRAFHARFVLTDQGDLELEGLEGGAMDEIVSRAYPLLDEALEEAYDRDGDEPYDDFESLPAPRRALVTKAVKQERGRIKIDQMRGKEPQTELGREIKRQTDMPAFLIDRIVGAVATERLKRFKGRGEPH